MKMKCPKCGNLISVLLHQKPSLVRSMAGPCPPRRYGLYDCEYCGLSGDRDMEGVELFD